MINSNVFKVELSSFYQRFLNEVYASTSEPPKGNSDEISKFIETRLVKLALNGQYLPKNHYVSTGTCTKAIPIYKGDTVKADFGILGNVYFVYN